MSDYFAHETAVIDDGAVIGKGTRIWHFAHVLSGARIGTRCNFGQNTMVGSGVEIGDNVKVQNNVSIYPGATIESDVFLGPSCVLTNISNPRSQVVRQSMYEKTLIRRGASVGANATIVCGVTLGRYAFVAAGAVVTKSVPDYGFIVGVPGKQRGWMGRHGHPLAFGAPSGEEAEGELEDGDLIATCPESGFLYRWIAATDRVVCLTLDEEARLPDHLQEGQRSYRDFKDETREEG
ncbi:MAG: acyltransferase [Verrucomicrobiota bacterium]